MRKFIKYSYSKVKKMRQIISNFHSSSHSESLKFNIIFHQESFKENACENMYYKILNATKIYLLNYYFLNAYKYQYVRNFPKIWLLIFPLFCFRILKKFFLANQHCDEPIIYLIGFGRNHI